MKRLIILFSFLLSHVSFCVAQTFEVGEKTFLLNGQRLSREAWTTKYADSEEEDGNHTGDKTFDLQESTYWQTEKGTALPHLLVIDLGSEQTVTALEYLPRAEQGAPGNIKDFRIFIY